MDHAESSVSIRNLSQVCVERDCIDPPTHTRAMCREDAQTLEIAVAMQKARKNAASAGIVTSMHSLAQFQQAQLDDAQHCVGG